MDRAQKKAWIDGANDNFANAEILIVAHYKGLTVAEVTDLRVRIRAAGAGFRVTKNTLARRALEGTRFGALAGLFKGPTAVAYSQDPVTAAKALSEFAKTNEKLVLVGAGFGEQTLSVKEIQALAKLPSLNELRAKIIAILQTPATRIAGVLQAPAGQVARVTGAYAAKS